MADDIKDQEEPPFKEDFPETDYVLSGLCDFVNRAEVDMSIPISLLVGGILISGKLIGGREYFEYFGSSFVSSDMSDEGKKQVKEFFGAPANLYGPKTDQDDSNGIVRYIHLKDAKVFSSAGSPIPGNSGVFWRGRLSEVDGFWMGQLSAS